MDQAFLYIGFVLGFVFLIKGADFLIEGGASLAQTFGISATIIGLTVIAFGTSLPELIINILASYRGQNGIAYGNIIGSNIANVFLILGVTALLTPLPVKLSTTTREVPFALLAALALVLMTNDVNLNGTLKSVLSRSDGLVLILFFLVFLYYIYTAILDSNSKGEQELPKIGVAKSIVYIFLGFLGLGLGGEWILNGAVGIAKALGLSDKVIGLTIVAIGTSLPELAASVVAAKKNQPEMAVGNVVGSNIFNIFWVLGLSASINPLVIPENTGLDSIMLLASGFLLFIFLFIGHKHVIERWQGFCFLSFYLAYTVWLVI